MFSEEFGVKAGATVSNKYQIQLEKKYQLPRKSRSSHCRCSVKEGVQDQHRCFPVNLAKFLRTPILKNICERLLLKISTLVQIYRKELIPEFYYPFKIFQYPKFCQCFCYVTCIPRHRRQNVLYMVFLFYLIKNHKPEQLLYIIFRYIFQKTSMSGIFHKLQPSIQLFQR